MRSSVTPISFDSDAGDFAGEDGIDAFLMETVCFEQTPLDIPMS